MAVNEVFGKINVLGLGSGLDLQGLIDKLREIRERPIEDLRARKDYYEKTIQEYDYLHTRILELKEQVLSLSLSSTYLSRRVEVSGEALSATAEVGALTGNFSVTVHKLAEKSVWESQGFSEENTDIAPLGEEVLGIQVGDQSFEVSVPQGTTLRGLVDLINNAPDNPGVTARLVNTGEPGDPYRIMLISNRTGEPGRIMITRELGNVSFTELTGVPEAWRTSSYDAPTEVVNDTGADINLTLQVGTHILNLTVSDGTTLEELSNLINQAASDNALDDYLRAYVVRDAAGNYYVEVRSPEDLTVSDDWDGGDLFPTQVNATGESLNAALTVDGVTYYRNTNKISDILPGVTLRLTQTGTATLRISEDYRGIEETFKNFIEGVNELIRYIREKSGVDPETGEHGPLYGSDVAQNLIRDLQQGLLTVVDQTEGFRSLFDLGVNFNRDGTITVDEERLSRAISENPEGIMKLLAGDEESGLVGIAETLNSLLGGYLGRSGLIGIAREGVERRIEFVEKEISREEASLERYVEEITRQFVALDSYLQELNQLSFYLDAQFKSLSGLKPSKK